MAALRVSENPEVDQHYATQTGLTAELALAVGDIGWNGETQALPEYETAVAALVVEYESAAISLAADFYESLRADTVPGRFNSPITTPMPAQAVEAYLDATIKKQMATDLETILADIEAQVEAAAQSIVDDAARRQLIDTTQVDQEAHGWARVTRPGACSFCLMLAMRGPVYRSRETANFRAHTKFNGRGGNCQCTVEPLFGSHYEAPAHVRAAQALYASLPPGLNAREARNAFRQALAAERAN